MKSENSFTWILVSDWWISDLQDIIRWSWNFIFW
jgi:hypothetical protein